MSRQHPGRSPACGRLPHLGIEKIVEASAAIIPKIRLIAGGFHLAVAPDDAIAKMVSVLKDTFKAENVAPGHCTGEPAFAALKQAWPWHFCSVGTEHGDRRATWGGTNTRKGRTHYVSQARPPRRPLRRPSGAEFAITLFAFRRPVTVRTLSTRARPSSTAPNRGGRERDARLWQCFGSRFIEFRLAGFATAEAQDNDLLCDGGNDEHHS